MEIGCYSVFGVDFWDFRLKDNCNIEQNEENNYSYNQYNKKYPLSGNKYFYVKDFETYILDLK